MFSLSSSYEIPISSTCYRTDLAAFQACLPYGIYPRLDLSTSTKQTFGGDKVTHLYCTNREVAERNIECLKRVGEPIVLMKAKHSGEGSKGSVNDSQGLNKLIYLCKGAKILVTKNIWQQAGLCNGASVIVVDMIFDREYNATDLATCAIVDFGSSYTGPSFYGQNEQEKRGWVPISPVVVQWNTVKNGETRTSSRKMFPFRLCYAWTIWKAQGQTIRGKVVVHLGKDEKEHGLTYTAFSRVTKFSDIGTAGGFTAERLTSKIRRNKKVKPRILEERKLKKKGQNTSISLLHNEIISLLAKANAINNDMTNEHQRYFNKSIENLTLRVNEERKFKWIRQAEEHLHNYIN